jgi:hypothetical protein
MREEIKVLLASHINRLKGVSQEKVLDPRKWHAHRSVKGALYPRKMTTPAAGIL